MQSFVNTFSCVISMHSLFRAFYLRTKARFGYCKPLYCSPNGFLHAENQHGKTQIFMFLLRLSLEGTNALVPLDSHRPPGFWVQNHSESGGGGQDGFYSFLARKKKACSPIAIDKWATNPPVLCPRRHSSKEPARNEDAS